MMLDFLKKSFKPNFSAFLLAGLLAAMIGSAVGVAFSVHHSRLKLQQLQALDEEKNRLEVEWGQFLDAAGYPKTSQLPPGYRAAPPVPLVAVQAPAPRPAPATAAPAPAAAAPAAPPPVTGPTPDNPAGIRF